MLGEPDLNPSLQRYRNPRGALTLLALLGGLVAVATGCEEPLPVGPPEGNHPPFDGGDAYALVERQVAFGPRVPGRSGHAAQLAWMLARLDSTGLTVTADAFETPVSSGDTLRLTNVLVRVRPDLDDRVLLLAHWDTRPRSDQAPDPADRVLPVPGANDGASGTAVLLVLAEVMAQEPPSVGVDLLWVDGEDYGPGAEDMFLGSERYAAGFDPAEGPTRGLLLDMVGDRDPAFPVEAYSAERAPGVVAAIWGLAEELGLGDIVLDRLGPAVRDDHLPLNEAGLPTANLIDFSYGPGHAWWHTPEDTPDKVAAETLEVVGSLVAEWVYRGATVGG